MIKKRISAVLAMLICLSLLTGTAAFATENVKAKESFAYEHDPRDNPTAMRDIVVNPDAVYGFSPSGAEDSTLKEYVDLIDWITFNYANLYRIIHKLSCDTDKIVELVAVHIL